MATLQTNPDQVPDNAVEWTRELNISEIGRVGYSNMSFTLWDETSTTVPYVEDGSSIEISNSTFVEASNVAIDTASQTTSAVNWVIYVVSGATATATLTGTAPTEADYDVSKGGFYDGDDRYTGHYMYVDSAGTAYSNKGYLDYAGGAMIKYRIDDSADRFIIDGELETTDVITSPEGFSSGDATLKIKVVSIALSGGTIYQIPHGLTWANIRGVAFSATDASSRLITQHSVLSANINVHFNAATGSTGSLYATIFYV